MNDKSLLDVAVKSMACWDASLCGTQPVLVSIRLVESWPRPPSRKPLKNVDFSVLLKCLTAWSKLVGEGGYGRAANSWM